jgi:hypothetical protein
MDRRRFIAQTTALCVASQATPAAFASPQHSSGLAGLERVIVDKRFAPCATFASLVRQKGVQVSGIDGDLTALWFGDLAQHFAEGGAPVAGLTTARTSLIMTELARGPGVRVLWNAVHRPEPDGTVTHELQGSSTLVARATESDWASDWTSGLISALNAGSFYRRGPAGTMSATMRTPQATDRLNQTLASWILMPRVRGLS